MSNLTSQPPEKVLGSTAVLQKDYKLERNFTFTGFKVTWALKWRNCRPSGGSARVGQIYPFGPTGGSVFNVENRGRSCRITLNACNH